MRDFVFTMVKHLLKSRFLYQKTCLPTRIPTMAIHIGYSIYVPNPTSALTPHRILVPLTQSGTVFTPTYVYNITGLKPEYNYIARVYSSFILNDNIPVTNIAPFCIDRKDTKEFTAP